jgi:NAD(P)-dependent dehydrogenase (short-subunit alcohol dehydrogenase family)
MSIVSRLRGRGPNGFGYGSTAEEVTSGLDLSGVTVLLTGCNSGLGLECLRVLSRRGARVFGAARNRTKAEAACAEAAPGKSVALACDLAEPASVRSCIESIKQTGARLDAIICNAGIMALPRLTQAYGFELQFFTNHIGHFMLVTGLLGELGERGRVVVVSSDAHRRTPRGGIEFDNLSGDRNYGPWTAYGQSKLANLLFARELSKRLPMRGQTSNALHPGVISTNLWRNLPSLPRTALSLLAPLGMKSIPEGAATQCYVATHPGMTENGQYFSHCNVATPSRHGRNDSLAAQLWDVSERIVRQL